MMRNRIRSVIAVFAAVTLLLGGCAGKKAQSAEQAAAESTEQSAEQSTERSEEQSAAVSAADLPDVPEAVPPAADDKYRTT